MKFVVAITVFRQYELLPEAVEAIWSSTLQPNAIVVFDNGGTCPDVYGASVWRQRQHLGLAGSINQVHSCFHSFQDFTCIIQNDDLVVAPDTFEKMLAVPAPAVVTCDGFVCFREDAEIAQKVGKWDESFWPAYYEDADFVQRCYLAGVKITNLGPIYKKHGNHGGWPYQHMTPAEKAEFDAQVEANKKRFIAKWGGMPSDLEKARK